MSDGAARERSSVVVSGAGVISSLGSSHADLWLRFARGERATGASDIGGIGVDDKLVQEILERSGARFGRLDRFCRNALAAARLALADAAIPLPFAQPERIGLVIGTGLGCLLTNAEYNQRIVEQGLAAASPQLFAYTVSSAAAGEISIALGIHGPNTTFHEGLAAGLGAIGYGFDLIRAGRADVVLALGVDVCGPVLVDALRDMGLVKRPGEARAFVDAKAGVVPAEGAALLVLERADRARSRGVTPLARIDGWSAGFEPTLTEPSPVSLGIEATLARALASSGYAPAEVGAVIASAHGTPHDRVELTALRRTLEGAAEPFVLTPKDALGETFGASGSLATALALGMLARPAKAAAIGHSLAGEPLAEIDVASRLEQAPVVLIDALCYSGCVASLVLARAGEP